MSIKGYIKHIQLIESNKYYSYYCSIISIFYIYNIYYTSGLFPAQLQVAPSSLKLTQEPRHMYPRKCWVQSGNPEGQNDGLAVGRMCAHFFFIIYIVPLLQGSTYQKNPKIDRIVPENNTSGVYFNYDTKQTQVAFMIIDKIYKKNKCCNVSIGSFGQEPSLKAADMSGKRGSKDAYCSWALATWTSSANHSRTTLPL